jgi:hypothetical protein
MPGDTGLISGLYRLAWSGERVSGCRFCLLKVSGTNDAGEPNGEPTTSCAHCFRSSGLCWELRMVVSEPNGEPKSSALCHGFGLNQPPWARRGLDLLRRREEPVCRRGLARPCR